MINNNCYIIKLEINQYALTNRQNFMKYILYVSDVSMFDWEWYYQSSIFYILWNFKYYHGKCNNTTSSIVIIHILNILNIL